MSLGERAALEGLLSHLTPALSVEIGTAAGGSLNSIAAHSAEVHTLDLADEPERMPPNATFHQGDSKVVLPKLLDRLAAEGRNVDFALIDGSHSEEGTRADLGALLDSLAVTRTVILAHDSANPSIRAGLADAREHPKVTGWDLSFVPGRLAGPGHWEGQMWGGFALVIVGDLDGVWALWPQARFHGDAS
jgi:hypothetical protein